MPPKNNRDTDSEDTPKKARERPADTDTNKRGETCKKEQRKRELGYTHWFLKKKNLNKLDKMIKWACEHDYWYINRMQHISMFQKWFYVENLY